MAESQATNNQHPIQDLTGQRFGMLVVLTRAEKIRNESCWLCRCDCGAEKVVRQHNLKWNKNTTCRCSSKPRGKKSRTREYVIWIAMVQRCHDPRRTAYNRYGGRGIVVCQRWRDSFDAFLEDMGFPPSPRHTIDRIDNDGNYEPSNCRWATYTQQARNTRATRYVYYHGERMSLSEVAERVGMEYHKFWKRIKRGLSLEEAITRKSRQRVGKPVDINGTETDGAN